MIKFKRLLKSFSYALRGLFKIFHEEQNLRVQSLAAALVVGLGIFYRVHRWEWCILFLSISLVILMEIVNSAVERVTDVLKPRMSTYVKEIKDVMAAAVMMAAISSVLIGLFVFLPHIFRSLSVFV